MDQVTDVPRGAIRNHYRATQCNDFTGLLCARGITPTDIDGLMEFGDKVFILIETKHIGAHMPDGQRLAFERLVDALASTGRHAIALVAEHDTDADYDIDVAGCRVVLYRHSGEWRTPRAPMTVRYAVDTFLGLWAPEYLPAQNRGESG